MQCVDSGRRRAGRLVEQEVDLGQCRKAFGGRQFAHPSHERATPQHGNRHAGKHRGLQAADAFAHASDLPFAASALEVIDGVLAIDIAGRQEREPDRILELGALVLADNPDQLLLVNDQPAGEIVHAGDERDIDLAALNAIHRRGRECASQLDLNAREGFFEHREN